MIRVWLHPRVVASASPSHFVAGCQQQGKPEATKCRPTKLKQTSVRPGDGAVTAKKKKQQQIFIAGAKHPTHMGTHVEHHLSQHTHAQHVHAYRLQSPHMAGHSKAFRSSRMPTQPSCFPLLIGIRALPTTDSSGVWCCFLRGGAGGLLRALGAVGALGDAGGWPCSAIGVTCFVGPAFDGPGQLWVCVWEWGGRVGWECGGVSDAVRVRCGYWGCSVDPFSQFRGNCAHFGGPSHPQSACVPEPTRK